MVKAIDEQVFEDLIGYRQNPYGFSVDILGLKKREIWPKMREVLDAVATHQFVCVRAGHSVSKTFSTGRVIVPWFKTCFQPSTVLTTAPSDNQVKNQLWREIRAGVTGARFPLGGKVHTTTWDVRPGPVELEKLPHSIRGNWEKNFAIGFSTSPDTVGDHTTKMQGWHNEWFMAIIDEACGIMPAVWDTIVDKLIVDEQCKILAIGNPTDPESNFANACYSSDPDKNEGSEPYVSDLGWYVVTIPSTETPNYKQGKRVIPGLASREWVNRIIKKYGENGDGTRVRVRGLFPTCKEGTYFGQFLSLARKEGRIGRYPHDETALVYTFSDFGDVWTATGFIQFIRGRIRVIDDYWDYEGLGLPAWCRALTTKGYSYGGHFAGPDLVGSNAKNFQTGKTTIDIAASLGYDLQAVIKHGFDDGIQAARGIFKLVEINEEKCPTLLKGVAGYCKKKNAGASTDDQVVYHDQPAKTWHRHWGDMWRHLAMAFRYMEIGEEYIGDSSRVAAYHEAKHGTMVYDPMSYV